MYRTFFSSKERMVKCQMTEASNRSFIEEEIATWQSHGK